MRSIRWVQSKPDIYARVVTKDSSSNNKERFKKIFNIREYMRFLKKLKRKVVFVKM